MPAHPLIVAAFVAIPCLPAMEVPPVAFHGFVSQGALYSQDNNYLADNSSKGSLQFNEIAINASSQVNEHLRVGMQFFARDLGQFGNDRVAIDWAFADYRASDMVGLRVGRYRVPFGLYNESMDLDLAFTSVLLPQAVYNLGMRDIMAGLNGVQVYGHLPIRGLDYQVHLGDQSLDNADYMTALLKEAAGLTTVDKASEHFLCGAQLSWTTPVEGLRAVAGWLHIQDFEVDGTVVVAGANPMPVVGGPSGQFVMGDLTIEADTSFTQFDMLDLGSEYQVSNWTLAAEYRLLYGLTKTTLDTPATAVGPATRQIVPGILRSDGAYLMASYRIDDRWEVGSYYGTYWADRTERTGDSTNYQRDLALSLRCDLSPSWAVKVEGHLMDGTALLLRSENPQGVEPHWWMLAAKTTVSF